MSDIYNKNAREKALLEEAYSYVYNEGQIDWKKATKNGKPAGQAYKDELKEKGHRKFKGPEGTTSATIPPGKEFKKDVDDLLARGYTEIGIEDAEDADDEWNRAENERESARDRAGELSDDWEKPNYRGDQHDFQPGEIVEVGPWGENDEYDHLEVVLQIKGDVINTIPITDDAYGMQYGGRGGADISLIRPQSEIDYDHSDFKPADGREW